MIHMSREERPLAHKVPSKYLVMLLIQYTVCHLEHKKIKLSEEIFSTAKDTLIYCTICEKITAN